MKIFNTRVYIALGLASLAGTVVLLAALLGLVPDRASAVREGRAALAEAIAAQGTALIGQSDWQQMEAILGFVVKRNPELHSAALRTRDGSIVVSVGNHAARWEFMGSVHSTDSQVQVPLRTGSEIWGQLELRYEPISSSGLLAIPRLPLVQFTAFAVLASFLTFYFYLGKVLTHLDPSRAIPGRVRAALDTLTEGLLVIDRKKRIVLANAAFAQLIGKSPEALIGQDADGLSWLAADGNPEPEEKHPWTRTLSEATVQSNRMMGLTDAAGLQRTFIANCAPILDGRERATGALISLDDVTQLEQNKVELGKAKERAEAASRAKSDFLANMSHDIRTPMNAVLGFTELLKRGYGKNEADARKYLETIHASGKHLLELINDILDLSKIEAGHLEVERIDFAPFQIVREITTMLSVRAREKNIGLELTVDGRIPARISSDPTCFKRIVMNLAGNAIKFTERGRVLVTLRLLEGKQPILAVDVSDTGIGIAQDKLGSVFEPFTQADGSVTRRFGGTGLGLTISRRFARALGGDIVVQSEPGKGSTFTATIETGSLAGVALMSREELQSEASREAAGRQGRWQFHPARVLVVDDGIENRELLSLVLSEAGLHVREAENGQVAVQKAGTEAFDVILMDMQMPVLDGYSATRQLRAKGLKTPIIALTANAMKGAEKDVLAAGCSEFLTKPVDIDKLLGRLGTLLGGRWVEQDFATPAASFEPASAAAQAQPPVVSRLAGHVRLRPAIVKFATRLQEQIAMFDTALANADFDELARLAHWLKGAGGTVGYDQYTEPAALLEQAAKAAQGADAAQLMRQIKALSARMVVPHGEAAPAVTTT
jgi:PAS domain S-box-containing protein